MATFSKTTLSASTDGKAILVAATATPGTLIHTGSTTTSTLHEVWLYAQNTSASDVLLTVEWGDATAPQNNIKQTIKAQAGLALVVPGDIIKGNATALTVKAFAATTNVITIHGYVNVIA